MIFQEELLRNIITEWILLWQSCNYMISLTKILHLSVSLLYAFLLIKPSSPSHCSEPDLVLVPCLPTAALLTLFIISPLILDHGSDPILQL
jgi:hypothetical protein